MQVIRIAGIEAEQDFSFAALHRLLQPSLDRIDSLPGPQRDGLSSAFGLASVSCGSTSPWPCHVDTTGRRRAERGLLCIVDDSQWIDLESLQAMTFAARRLQADGIALLFGLQNHGRNPSRFRWTPCPRDLWTSQSGRTNCSQPSWRALSIQGWRRTSSSRPVGALWPSWNSRMTCPPLSGRAQIVLRSHCQSADGLRRTSIVRSRRYLAECRCFCWPELPKPQAMFCWSERQHLQSVAIVIARQSLFRRFAPQPEPVIEFRHPLIRSAVYTGANPAIGDRYTVHSPIPLTVRQIRTVGLSSGRDRHRYDEQLATHLEAGATRAPRSGRLRG